MKPCFIVLFSSNSEGIDAYAFYKENDAKKSILDDCEILENELRTRGYDPVVLCKRTGDREIYVPDTDLYYEWTIHESSIN